MKGQATVMRTKFVALFLAFGLAGNASADARLEPDWHPLVFNMMESWLSDVESPVVTEVNLDAVRRNRNQFDKDEVKREGEWILYRAPDGGFKRYRVLEHKADFYKVEYQDNGGGTLTTRSLIGFTLDKREITVNGKAKIITALRVISFSR